MLGRCDLLLVNRNYYNYQGENVPGQDCVRIFKSLFTIFILYIRTPKSYPCRLSIIAHLLPILVLESDCKHLNRNISETQIIIDSTPLMWSSA